MRCGDTRHAFTFGTRPLASRKTRRGPSYKKSKHVRRWTALVNLAGARTSISGGPDPRHFRRRRTCHSACGMPTSGAAPRGAPASRDVDVRPPPRFIAEAKREGPMPRERKEGWWVQPPDTRPWTHMTPRRTSSQPRAFWTRLCAVRVSAGYAQPGGWGFWRADEVPSNGLGRPYVHYVPV